MPNVSKQNFLEGYYNLGIYEFKTGDKLIKKRLVVWAEREKILAAVVEEHRIIGTYKVKVVAVGGERYF